jgi:hypothetical protein
MWSSVSETASRPLPVAQPAAQPPAEPAARHAPIDDVPGEALPWKLGMPDRSPPDHRQALIVHGWINAQGRLTDLQSVPPPGLDDDFVQAALAGLGEATLAPELVDGQPARTPVCLRVWVDPADTQMAVERLLDPHWRAPARCLLGR